MFCQKPVIISDLEWSYEFLPKNSVYKVSIKNEKKLVEGIIQLSQEKNLREKIARNGFKVAKEKFQYEKNMKKMELIMQKFLQTDIGND